MFRTRFSYLTTFILSSLLASPALLAQCPNFSNPPSETLGIGDAPSPGAMLFLPNGCLVSNNNDGISYYAFDSNTCSYPTTPQEIGIGTPNNLATTLAFVPSCNLLLAIDATNNTVQQYRVTGCALVDLDNPISVGTGETIASIAVSPNGTCVAVLSTTTLYMYPIASSPSCQIPSSIVAASVTLDPSYYSYGNVAFMSDSCIFATTGTAYLISVAIDPTNCQFFEVPTYTGITDAKALSAIAISPTGNCYAVGDSGIPGKIYTSSVGSSAPSCNPTGLSYVELPGETPNSLAFSADGTCLAVSTFDNTYLYNVAASCSPVTPPQILPISSGNAIQAALYSTSTCDILAVGSAGSDKTGKSTQSKNNPLAQLKKAKEERKNGVKEAQNSKPAQAAGSIFIYKVVTAVPHLTITKECSKKVCKKECITYEITVTNTGTGASLAGAVVTDVLPHCVSFVETDATQYTIHGQTFTATLPAIAAGASVVITIIAKGHAHHKKEVTNSASLTYQGQTTESNECTTCIRH